MGRLQIPGSRALFIAMAGHHQIWSSTSKPGKIGVWAGTGDENIVDGDRRDAALRPAERPGDRRQEPVRRRQRGLRRPRDHAASTPSSPHVGRIVGEGLFEFGDVDGIGRRGPAPALPRRRLPRRQALRRRHLQQQDQGLRPQDPRRSRPSPATGKPGDDDNPPRSTSPAA